MKTKLHTENPEVVDGENNPVVLDMIYTLKGDSLQTTLQTIQCEHPGDVYFLPLSGTSGGGGIFQVAAPQGGKIVGLRLATTPQPKIRLAEHVDIRSVALDEIIIDKQQRSIYAGAGITLDQLNQSLAAELGHQFKVLGADLTSYTYAQTGATFMTGGMGPQRRYFSDSVTEISLYDGGQLISIDGDELNHYAGTYGWTGLVSAVRCQYVQLPTNEIAFALPVNGDPSSLALLLEHFSPYTYLEIQSGVVKNSSESSNVILGLEHISASAMQPLFSLAENHITLRARGAGQKVYSGGSRRPGICKRLQRFIYG